LHQKESRKKNINMRNTSHTPCKKKNDLLGLGLDPRIVVEVGEK
jgi:hypothetical protein